MKLASFWPTLSCPDLLTSALRLYYSEIKKVWATKTFVGVCHRTVNFFSPAYGIAKTPYKKITPA